MTKPCDPQVEFSRLISADQIGPQETEREIVANAAERQRLAERFGLISLDRLSALLHLKRGRAGLIHMDGRLEAEVVQACVVTLEPVRSQVAETFSLTFAAKAKPAAGGVVIDIDAADPPEALIDGRLDLGEAVAQQLAVALDPYPRAPAASGRFEPSESGVAARKDGRQDGPFAALEAWRKE